MLTQLKQRFCKNCRLKFYSDTVFGVIKTLQIVKKCEILLPSFKSRKQLIIIPKKINKPIPKILYDRMFQNSRESLVKYSSPATKVTAQTFHKRLNFYLKIALHAAVNIFINQIKIFLGGWGAVNLPSCGGKERNLVVSLITAFDTFLQDNAFPSIDKFLSWVSNKKYYNFKFISSQVYKLITKNSDKC